MARGDSGREKEESKMKKKPQSGKVSHLDSSGRSRMVDVGDKPVSDRRALAKGRIRLSAAAWKALQNPLGSGKGDPLHVAQVAAIQAAKRTGEFIPLAHPLPLRGVEVNWKKRARSRVLEVAVRVRTIGPTGVEMEALTAVSAALLTVYDMLKAVDRGMTIGPIWLSRKEGGQSGLCRFDDPPLI
jgi:cyclic pyranopterin phosphate synthase